MGTVIFPSITASDLNGREVKLPHELEGELNFVLLGFQIEHQALVDTWLPWIQDQIAKYPTIDFYELPVASKLNPVTRFFIDEGMRAGLKDKQVRARTITIYTDMTRFLDQLQVTDTSTVTVLLVDNAGVVLERATGAFDSSSANRFSVVLADKRRI